MKLRKKQATGHGLINKIGQLPVKLVLINLPFPLKKINAIVKKK